MVPKTVINDHMKLLKMSSLGTIFSPTVSWFHVQKQGPSLNPETRAWELSVNTIPPTASAFEHCKYATIFNLITSAKEVMFSSGFVCLLVVGPVLKIKTSFQGFGTERNPGFRKFTEI